MQHKNQEPPPRLSDLGTDLLRVTMLQQVFTVGAPFVFAALFFYAGFTGHPVVAVLATVFLSFITYGSTSHDLVHRNLGLPPRINEVFLSLIELIALRSGHAYRAAHLYHHAQFPAGDDIEAAAAKRTFFGALLDGTTFHLRLYFWALRRARGIERRIILGEGIAVAVLYLVAIAMVKLSIVPLVYAALMTCGAWITPLVTSYVPHNASGNSQLEQTRLFRGRVLSLIALEHLYHLEHHLYPAVPHQNWVRLAKRLDPYFERQQVKVKRLWF
jgi:beta-carotene hydroxylase